MSRLFHQMDVSENCGILLPLAKTHLNVHSEFCSLTYDLWSKTFMLNAVSDIWEIKPYPDSMKERNSVCGLTLKVCETC